jgi:uncharacterized membrane protein
MMRWLAGVLLGAVLVHFAALWALPRAIMARATSLLARGGANAWSHGPLATAESRTIVRPSPDLAYSSLAFDVSEHALELHVPLSAPYTSLSGFASNTDNFFAVNDQTAEGDEIALVLVGPGAPRGDFGGLRVVEAPSDRGILLVRRVVTSPGAFAAVDEVRQRATAVPR